MTILRTIAFLIPLMAVPQGAGTTVIALFDQTGQAQPTDRAQQLTIRAGPAFVAVLMLRSSRQLSGSAMIDVVADLTPIPSVQGSTRTILEVGSMIGSSRTSIRIQFADLSLVAGDRFAFWRPPLPSASDPDLGGPALLVLMGDGPAFQVAAGPVLVDILPASRQRPAAGPTQQSQASARTTWPLLFGAFAVMIFLFVMMLWSERV